EEWRHAREIENAERAIEAYCVTAIAEQQNRRCDEHKPDGDAWPVFDGQQNIYRHARREGEEERVMLPRARCDRDQRQAGEHDGPIKQEENKRRDHEYEETAPEFIIHGPNAAVVVHLVRKQEGSPSS